MDDSRFAAMRHHDRGPDRLVSTREMAARLGITPATLARWTREGRVPAVRLGARAIRYRVGEVLAAFGDPSGGGS